MSTLKELIYYCSEEDPLGAVLVTGEWGCGKTFLIDTKLSDAIRNSHLIVRVSLFGINSIEALNEAVHRQWLYVCTPFLGKLKKHRDRLSQDSNFFLALSNVVRSLNPIAGNVATAMVAVDPIDLIPITPVIDDFTTGDKKHVVLVFDDLERTKLDEMEILGCINDYCENRGFNTIIVANEEFLLEKNKEDSKAFLMMKEKVVAHTVLYEPDYPEVIHAVIADRTWQSEPYKAFLLKNEQMILEAFESDSLTDDQSLAKLHDIRSLICAMKQFFRVYVHLDHYEISEAERYLYSFIVYTIAVKCGYIKDGEICRDFNEEDLVRLYPKYSAETLPPSIQKWIEYGVWDREEFDAEIHAGHEEAGPRPDAPSAPKNAQGAGEENSENKS